MELINRSAHRGRSRKDFIYKIGLAEEEADESLYWLNLINAFNSIQESIIQPLIKEANELTAILTTIWKNSKL